MAVTCKKCSKTISRNDDSIACSKDSSHLFHIQCVNLTVENLETMKKSGTSKIWLCDGCSLVDITSKTDMSNKISTNTQISYEDLLKNIEIIVVHSFKTLFLPAVEELKIEIGNLQDQVSSLKAENSKLKSIKHQETKTQTKVKTYNEVIKANIDQNSRNNSSTSISKVEKIKKPQQDQLPSNSKLAETKDSTNSCPSTSESQKIKEDEFITVRNKKPRRIDRSIVGSGKPDGMSIKGALKYGYLHVCKLEPSLQPEILVKHLNTKGFNDIICEKLESKRPKEYSSFKITVPAQNFEDLKKPELWPEGSRINHFLFRLNRSKTLNLKKTS